MIKGEKRTKAHIVYKNKDGQRIPGVTTILSVLNKPALITWANRLGLEGIDSTKFTDKMATIGTLAHEMILAHFEGVECDTSEYSKDDIDKAENSLLSFFEWEKGKNINSILLEVPLISEEYQFGGTVDFFGEIDGELFLVDFKTSKALYSEMFYQLAAYQVLLKENGHAAKKARILRIGRDKTEGFEERVFTDLSKHFDVFKYCLKIYNLQKELKT